MLRTLHNKEYCILRNKATKVVRYARIRHEKGIADSVMENCLSFWSYVKSRTGVRPGVADLKDEHGVLKSDTKDQGPWGTMLT